MADLPPPLPDPDPQSAGGGSPNPARPKPTASDQNAAGQGSGDPKQRGAVDSRLTAFLRRAGPIIAAERGLNESARVKLRAIAADMKLPDGVFDTAISMLQDQPPVAKRELTRYEAAFEKSMRIKLQNVPRGIVTARVENRAVEVGVVKYQLTELQSREILRSLVGELKLQRISVTQSERHMEATIEDLIGEQTYASEETRSRLAEFGNDMGLPREHVEAMIRHYVDLNLLNRKKEGQFVKIAGVVAAVILLGLSGVIAWSLSNSNKPAESVESRVKDPVIESEPVITRADFWDDTLDLSVMNVGRIRSEFGSVQDQIASADVETRIAGYRNLIKSVPDLVGSKQLRQYSGSMLQGLIRQEPDESAARELLGEIRSKVMFDEEDLPIESQFMFQCEWLLDQLVAAGADSGDGTSIDIESGDESLRTALISDELFRLTGRESADGKLPTQQRTFRAGLLEAQLQRLSAVVGARPPEAIASFPVVFAKTTGVVRDSRRIELSTAFLAAAMEPANGDWKKLSAAIEWTVKRSKPEQLVQFISVYESLSNSAAQQFLGGQLVDRIGVPTSTEPTEVAAWFRLKLGIEEPKYLSVDRKRSEFVSSARELRTTVDPLIDRPETLSVDIARVAYWTTFATYVRRSDIDSAGFAALEKIGPPENRLTRSYLTNAGVEDADDEDAEEGKVGGGGSNGNSIGRDLRIVGANFKAKSLQQRVGALRRIAAVGREFENAPIDLASGFAQYLLSEKRDNEQREAMIAMQQIAHWPALMIGIADFLPDSTLVREKQPNVVAELVTVPPLEDDMDGWRESARVALLTEALDRYRLLGVKTASGSEVSYNYLQAILLKLNRQRAINFGVPMDQVALDVPMEKLFRNWYLHLATSAGGEAGGLLSGTSAASGPAAADAIRKSDSVDFLSESPLQKVVLYQQLIIEELKSSTFSKSRWSKPAVQVRLDELNSKQQKATNVFQQMLCNELTLLELMLAESAGAK